MSTINAFDTIKSLFDKYGNRDYIGESVTQLEHFLQCATLAEKDNEPDEIIVAALLHDIGHLLIFDRQFNKGIQKMDNLGVHGHENIGANFLNKLGFNNVVVNLVKNHVNAKRYMLNRDNTYTLKLSDASQRTLQYQGGIMSDFEADEFEKNNYYKDYIKIRIIDDSGKKIGNDYYPLDHFKDKIYKCIKS